jgi:hypothetical protein
VCIREYWCYQEEITAQDGILFKGMRVIVPNSLRAQIVDRAHSSHLGMEAGVRRARNVLFWLGMAADIKNKVSSCEICSEYQIKQQREPLMTPSTPWCKVAQGSGLFGHGGLLVTTWSWTS